MIGHVGLVWFGQNSEAEFNTMNQSILMVGIELLGRLKRMKPEVAPCKGGAVKSRIEEEVDDL